MKAETLALMDKRGEIETEMNSIISRLCAPDGPGLTGNLLDAEGYPRADIDIPVIRADRQRLSVLRSDHKDVTEKIEKNIEILHSGNVGITLPQKRTAEGEEVAHPRTNSALRAESSNFINSIPSSTHGGPTAVREDSHHSLPFAVFDEVQEGSPAALDGIMYGDQLVKFGSVEGGENLLLRLAREGHMNEGNAIPVIVIRRGIQVQLSVIPRQWSGAGLLGCHIQQL